MKKVPIVILIIFTTNLMFGQKLIKNINPQAKHLKHRLDKKKERLLLNSTKFIKEVMIINDTTTTNFPIYNYTGSVKLNDMLLGKNTVIVKELGDMIVFTVVIKEKKKIKKKLLKKKKYKKKTLNVW